MKIRVKFRTLAFLGSLAIAVVVLLTLASFEVTSRPQFCGTCHIMKPYYQSWKISNHNKIACVDCHIPPGVTSELRKKYEAISMVVRYFTATYGTHPWAEVEDETCLQCHERRLISGKVTIHGVNFDHTPHLAEMKRGKKLRCTSCHSQIVQGSHIAVTTSTCILCHFKDKQPGTSTARCQICHPIPDKVTTPDGYEFKHADVKKFDMRCEWCHAGVISGNGEVPKTRCLSCHMESARLEKFGQTEELHKIHVTDHKVECLLCHNQILHGVQKAIHTVDTDCVRCHAGGHSPQQTLYAGIGGKGVQPMPSPMYQAGVTCEGCHFISKTDQNGPIQRASEVSCMACHGAAFNKIFDRWKTYTTDRLKATDTLLTEAERQIAEPYPQALMDAQDNLRLIHRAVPVHNVDYTLALLDKSVELMNVALKEKGKAPVTAPWRTFPYTSPCLSCHQGIENQSGTFRGKPFIHFPHVIKNELDCETCHVPHQIPPKELPMAPDVDCASCHHDTSFESKCKTCHAEDIVKTITVRGQVLDRKGLGFVHEMHIEATEKKCVDCHFTNGTFTRTPAAANCADCHS